MIYASAGLRSFSMSSLQTQIEALLFAARTALPVRSLCRLLDINSEQVHEALGALNARYEGHDSALEVRKDEGGYLLSLKPDFYGTVSQIIPPSVRNSVLATLTVIAREQPVSQAYVVQVRGQKAYNHIKNLLLREWITKTPHGNTSILRTTSEFSKAFHVTDDPVEIRRLLEEAGLPDPDQIP